jgi:outer membrane protein assembly factor BamD
MTRRWAGLLLCVVALSAAGCGANRSQVPPGTREADQFLFNRGQEEFKERNWLAAREYYRQVVDNYPQSPFRPDSKLAVGDSYIGEDTTESLLLAINEFREFLTFYPTNARADYAQFRLSYAYTQQMLAADRDQSATRDAIKELQVFIDRYPNSSLMPEARKLMREAKDRLSESSYRIGFHYFRVKWYRGAIDRFQEILKDDPEYTRKDAVYFHLAESFRLSGREPKNVELLSQALPYYDRLIKEFEQSEFLAEARKRVAEVKGELKIQ